LKKLTQTKNGEKGHIAKISGDTRFLSRITSIGLNIGCPIEVLQNVKKCPILVYGRDTMIALNKNDCENIFVEVIL
jgi:ferrous iron transport protein A